MVVNNWMVTTNMLCTVVGSEWPRWYVASFITITVWIMLSCLVAFVLEIHASVSEEVQNEWDRRLWVKNLRLNYELDMKRNSSALLEDNKQDMFEYLETREREQLEEV